MKVTASLLVALPLFMSPLLVQAGEVAFNQSQYNQLLSQGKPVIVDFYADWCSTCKAQKPIVEDLLRSPAFKDVTLFLADFDRETALKRSLHITQQSTFVVFKGGKEIARSTGQTRKNDINALFNQAL